ncbi:MAG TPA: hypothetical protein V6C81_18935 [Planktothrix sp.]|jgi:hypothetical protein
MNPELELKAIAELGQPASEACSGLAHEAAALLSGGKAATALEDLSQISKSRWLNFRGCGYTLKVAEAADGSPTLRVLGSSKDYGGAQFSLGSNSWLKSWAPDSVTASGDAMFPQEIKSQAWHTLTGSNYQLQLTQFSNKGPLFIINDLSGNEKARGWADLLTGSWKLTT